MLKISSYLDNNLTRELPADPVAENYIRQVAASYSYVLPEKPSAAVMIHYAKELALELGFEEAELESADFLQLVSGGASLENSKPYAMNYGGHQFGHWAGQLGDGRAMTLGEFKKDQLRWVLQLKGAGKTPYSRRADGKAVLRSSIREYLCSEAIHYLGVPTTRALSLVETGDQVLRDVLYDGHPAYEKGAVVARVAPSFLRFGNFELPAQRGDLDQLKALVAYTINYFYPHLGTPSKATYIAFFKEVTRRTLETIVHWQRVGFVHGVLNTDNMSILGLTIDYGPYGWLDAYDPAWTPNTTDLPQKRYRFENQANVGLWNLYQLANALYPLIEDLEAMEEVLASYETEFREAYTRMLLQKIGLENQMDGDLQLLVDLEKALQLVETDMTIFYRNLSNFNPYKALDGLHTIKDAFYVSVEENVSVAKQWRQWFLAYAERLKRQTITQEERKIKMDAVNPKYVLRNYMAQLAIDKAEEGDYSLVAELSTLLKRPYDEQVAFEHWFAKRPEWARDKIGCSMLSCSS